MTQWRPQEGNICHAGGGSYTGTKFERIAEMARKQQLNDWRLLSSYQENAAQMVLQTESKNQYELGQVSTLSESIIDTSG
ncbi:MAG: hypothetical protein VB056_12835 [Sphaerochaeta associata]|uniref:hypothetical protein n=1 Tax=Sphaerochaeta associata TaxID=1129264 RepID=UPI002B1FA261|nr:hypothetical protein [Sphaerochaeta associata]MEA4871300.1 hypothetical protein [Synergistaceae bacterium]MEA5029759.1 hypothetical protein [Sphaerochaeta associata]